MITLDIFTGYLWSCTPYRNNIAPNEWLVVNYWLKSVWKEIVGA